MQYQSAIFFFKITFYIKGEKEKVVTTADPSQRATYYVQDAILQTAATVLEV
jgi:hypothetical protein